MTKKIDYDKWSKEELVKEIVKIKSTIYGLVWHRDLPEEKIDILINPDARTPNEMFPNEMAGKPFPILKEVKSKAIESDKSKLVNLLIEGDNYHSLAVLNFTHREAVDLIYIDPPYNTGNSDFIYNDKYVDKEDSFRHSKWLSFMEKRLKLSKNLLKQNGLLFISIDDNEQAPLKMLCDEIFGDNNFIANIVWRKKYGGGKGTRFFVDLHEYVLVYAKDITQIEPFLLERSDKQIEIFKEKDEYYKERGLYYIRPLKSGLALRKTLIYPIRCPDGSEVKTQWICGRDTFEQQLKEGRIVFKKLKNGKYNVYKKFYERDSDGLVHPESIFYDLAYNQNGKEELKEIFNIKEGREIPFENPKPTKLIKHLLTITGKIDATVLDFMAGSGTTGHAVLELNKEDGGKRKFILCTNNGDEKSKHKIASDICYPRVKKVATGYLNNKGQKIDGLGGNLKYFVTDFVEAEPTDKNKRKLVKESTDMICILENAFELIQETPEFKIFKNTDKYVGVIFYEEAIEDYKKAIKKINGHFNTYVFSMGDDPHTKKFADVKSKVTLCAIPEIILKVYREIFK
jgi:adenine-specific DNA-methyltransferase